MQFILLLLLLLFFDKLILLFITTDILFILNNSDDWWVYKGKNMRRWIPATLGEWTNDTVSTWVNGHSIRQIRGSYKLRHLKIKERDSLCINSKCYLKSLALRARMVNRNRPCNVIVIPKKLWFNCLVVLLLQVIVIP